MYRVIWMIVLVNMLTHIDNSIYCICMEFLSTKEQKIIEVLASCGKSSVRTLTQEALINRTTIYPILEKLIEKGLVKKYEYNDITYFETINEQEFELWSKKQRMLFLGQLTELDSVIKNKNRIEKTLKTSVKYFEGYDGVTVSYQDTYQDNQEKIIYAITDYDSAYKNLNDFLEKDYFPARVNQKVRVQSILSKKSKMGSKDKSRAKELLRDMRYIDILNGLGIEINIYSNKIHIVSFDKKNPSAVIIQNEIIARAFKEIFSYIWKK